MDIKFYTTKEVAGILKVHRNTVINLIRNKKLVAIVVGKQYRISETQLKEYLDRNITQQGSDG